MADARTALDGADVLLLCWPNVFISYKVYRMDGISIMTKMAFLRWFGCIRYTVHE